MLKASSTNDLDELMQSGKLYERSSTDDDMTNALALAVCTANADACKFFLQYFSDVKNPAHFVWGYRQPYSWLHLVLDPNNHIRAIDFSKNFFNLEARLELIDLLVDKGADPNWTGNGCKEFRSIYHNPPLAAGEPSGRRVWDSETIAKLRQKLVHCGADPHLVGSSFYLSKYDIAALINSPSSSQSSLKM